MVRSSGPRDIPPTCGACEQKRKRTACSEPVLEVELGPLLNAGCRCHCAAEAPAAPCIASVNLLMSSETRVFLLSLFFFLMSRSAATFFSHVGAFSFRLFFLSLTFVELGKCAAVFFLRSFLFRNFFHSSLSLSRRR